MRQRVKVAQAIVHDPDVIVLDEPLTGLDPRQRLHMIELFQRLGAAGKCVIVSSHVLDEVERFGSRVLVMVQGRLAAEGDFRAIRDLMDDRPHRIRVRTDRARAVAGGLLEQSVVISVQLHGDDQVVVETDNVGRFRRTVAEVARCGRRPPLRGRAPRRRPRERLPLPGGPMSDPTPPARAPLPAPPPPPPPPRLRRRPRSGGFPAPRCRP